MKKLVFAAAIATGVLFGLSAQAAPLSSSVSGVQSQVTAGAVKVWHCRPWSGWCGWGHGRHRSHWRWGSRGW